MTTRIEQGEGFTISYAGDKVESLDYDETVYRVMLVPVGLERAFERLPDHAIWDDFHEFVREAIRRHLDRWTEIAVRKIKRGKPKS